MDMNEKKNKTRVRLIYIIIFVVYNILVFAVFKPLSLVFVISYLFMLIAFIAQMISMKQSFKTLDVETIFFGIPLASLSVYYFFAELFVSTVFMIFQFVGLLLPFVIQVVMLAAYVVIAIIALMTRDTVQDINQKIKDNVRHVRSILVDVEMLMAQCQDLDLKSNLRKLTETVKYSDPMTNESVADVEQRIMQHMSELRFFCEAKQIPEAKDACSRLELLFFERNKKLAISK